jgi:hypothetical protein
MYQRLVWWQDLLVAASVVLASAVVSSANLPNFVVVLAQFPLSIMLMLSFFGWDWQAWVYTYVVAMIYYVLLHMVLSLVAQYGSLLPAWKVRDMFRRQGSSF